MFIVLIWMYENELNQVFSLQSYTITYTNTQMDFRWIRDCTFIKMLEDLPSSYISCKWNASLWEIYIFRWDFAKNFTGQYQDQNNHHASFLSLAHPLCAGLLNSRFSPWIDRHTHPKCLYFQYKWAFRIEIAHFVRNHIHRIGYIQNIR